tara:strand:- start:8 stop:295 length:288 start_codon:yes stop_codon:yes gene_type:complete
MSVNSYDVSSNSSNTIKGKRKKSTQTNKVTNTSTGETTVNESSQADRGGKSKTKNVFKVFDSNGNLLVKQKDKVRRSGKTKTKLRVTRRGRIDGY